MWAAVLRGKLIAAKWCEVGSQEGNTRGNWVFGQEEGQSNSTKEQVYNRDVLRHQECAHGSSQKWQGTQCISVPYLGGDILNHHWCPVGMCMAQKGTIILPQLADLQAFCYGSGSGGFLKGSDRVPWAGVIVIHWYNELEQVTPADYTSFCAPIIPT